jgi:hypothetical protein
LFILYIIIFLSISFHNLSSWKFGRSLIMTCNVLFYLLLFFCNNCQISM